MVVLEYHTYFYQGGPINQETHVPGPVSQSSAESEYNAECTSWMSLSQFRMLNHELANKDTDVVPEQAHLIILYIKSAVFMSNNCKDTKHTIHIFRRMCFVRNGKKWNLYKTVWCEGGLQLEYIVTNNVREDEFNPNLGLWEPIDGVFWFHTVGLSI